MDEREAYWAGLVVSVIMLGSGFALLFAPLFTGYGAVILSLGIMTMIVVLMTEALITQIQKWMDYNARIEETVSTILALKVDGVEAKALLSAGDAIDKSEKPKVEEEELVAAN
jgi:hypothetical protein